MGKSEEKLKPPIFQRKRKHLGETDNVLALFSLICLLFSPFRDWIPD